MGRLRVDGKRVLLKSEIVDELATKRNLSISELARRCGYTENYFHKLMIHERSAGETVRNRIMETLGLVPGNEADFDRIFFIQRNNQQKISSMAKSA